MSKKRNIPYLILKIIWLLIGLYIFLSFLQGIAQSLGKASLGSAIEVVILILFGGMFLGVYIVITLLFLLVKWLIKRK